MKIKNNFLIITGIAALVSIFFMAMGEMPTAIYLMLLVIANLLFVISEKRA